MDALIGRGGMGSVFRAHDLQTGAAVAIKVLNRHAAEEAGHVDRFRREIAILSRIRHPAVPRILSWGELSGSLYFISEFVDGVNLKAEIARRGSWDVADAAALAATIADALGAAHALGIVHRDVNANNIMLAHDGGVRLLDFGIARDDDPDMTRITATGTIIGTPAYMAPEQFDGRRADPRTDVYALGVVLFEMLVGRLPFNGDTPVAVAVQHATETPTAVRTLRADVPKWLERLVARCLDKDPGRRFATGRELADALREMRRTRPPRRRRLASGDVVIEDFGQSDWALVLGSPREKARWAPGLALRFEGQFYRLDQIDPPTGPASLWTYSFVRWPEGEIFRGVVDYERDSAERRAREQSLRGRLLRLFRR